MVVAAVAAAAAAAVVAFVVVAFVVVVAAATAAAAHLPLTRDPKRSRRWPRPCFYLATRMSGTSRCGLPHRAHGIRRSSHLMGGFTVTQETLQP